MKIDRLLAEHQLLVTTAESCTGGLVASALVDIPGISDYFKEGYITYAPEAKEKILGVLPETISDYDRTGDGGRCCKTGTRGMCGGYNGGCRTRGRNFKDSGGNGLFWMFCAGKDIFRDRTFYRYKK